MIVIPNYVLQCLTRLEQAGFPAYIVGGCVRDACLGLTPHDYDMCTAALPEQTEALFSDFPLILAGKKHGTVAVVTDGGIVEITTFRTEGQYLDNRHPEWVRFVPDIGQDLARRDFTVNAMAYSPIRGFADPFGGIRDMTEGVLRTVGDPCARFQEDSLRILRGVRFSVKFRLAPEAQTLQAMEDLRGLMDNLARERVFDELCKLLLLAGADDLVRFAPILSAVIPELEPMIGFDQRNPHHAYDLFRHTAGVTEAVPPELPLRWAALLHDTGKLTTFTLDENGCGHFYGHARESARIADAVLRRLKAPTALRETVVKLTELHMTRIEPEKKAVRRWLSRLGPQLLDQLLTLQEADLGSKGTGIPRDPEAIPELRALMAELQAENACLTLKDLAVNGQDLISLGFTPGKELGRCLSILLSRVLEEQLPNEKQPLLDAAQRIQKEETP